MLLPTEIINETFIVKNKIMQKNIDIPLPILGTIAEMMQQHNLRHEVIAGNAMDNTITLEINYERETRSFMHDIEDYVEDFREGLTTID